jgi:AGCS family alanine or glycine:cation symporter
MRKTITRVFLVAILLSFSSAFYGQDESGSTESESDKKKERREKVAEEAGGVSTAINSVFEPVVAALEKVLFWDPFEAVGIYDPVVYSDTVRVSVPTRKGVNVSKAYLLEWYVADMDEVQRGDRIGDVVNSRDDTLAIYAPGTGVIDIRVKQGDVVYDKDVRDIQRRRQMSDIAMIDFGKNMPLVMLDEDGKDVLEDGEIQYLTKPIPIVVVWLILGAIFFTFRMRFINLWGVRHAIDLVRGVFSNPNDKGEVSHFQALATALSATVGLGNIAGVAVAISLGGPGASLWIIIAGFFGMASKFVECTLAVKYRDIDEDGKVYGGPMYYLSKALKLRGLGRLGSTLAVVFSVLCILASFGGGNMFQSNQAFEQVVNVFGTDENQLGNYGAVFGLVLAVLVGIVIIGGIRSIAKVTDKIVPLMVGIYVTFALLIIFFNFERIDDAFYAIYNGAFNASALRGGFIGVLIIGFQRAAFSNEAGVGSASIAHSASKTNEPVSEGIVALMEPLIDTVIVCTMTALVLIFTGYADGFSEASGAALTAEAFSSVFPWFNYVLLVAIILFAFSTMISWSYYGLKSWTYLFGVSNTSEYIYKGLFLLFIIVGASSSLGAVLTFSDMMILGMAFPNILGLYILSKEVYRDLQDYFKRIKSGEIKKYK